MLGKKTNLIIFVVSFMFVVLMIVDVVSQELITDEMRKAEIEAIIGKPMVQWGTTTTTYAISAFDCDPYSYNMVYYIDSGDNRLNRYCGPNQVCQWYCPVHIPSGAEISAVEVDGCDMDSVGYISMQLRRVHWGGTYEVLASGNSTTSGICSYWTFQLTTPHKVDNYYNTYVIYVNMISAADLVSLNSLRVFYTLTVSPAPPNATFEDVPTSHIFFQYVEALVNAGITGGCDSTHFCPNNYVTRGQMAKFLAIALGLNYR